MAFKDLREFLAELEKRGDLKKIDNADWDLEIGALTEMLCERDGPALLFDNIKGYPQGFRVASNLWGSDRRTALLLNIPAESRGVDLVRRLRDIKKSFKPVKPRQVRTGPVMENVVTGKDVNMFKFPTPKWHELDGGRYIGTGSATILKDPREGWINAGTYRVVIHDENTLGFYKSPGSDGFHIRQRYWDKGENCPVVVDLGPAPALFCASTYKLPPRVSELDFAGFIQGEPLDVIKGEFTGLPIPATSEIVIEGEAPPPEKENRMEGPFGESPGYYGAGMRPEPVIKVKAVYYRNNPILHGAPPVRPPLQYSPRHNLWNSVEMWDLLEQAGLPDIQGVYEMDAGRHSIDVISLKTRHPGHAKHAAHIVAGKSYFTRLIITVDEDIDPSDPNEVLWAVSTRCDPATMVDIVRGLHGSALDPILDPVKKANRDYTSSCLIIDACRPYTWKDKFPPVVKVSDALRQKMLEEWGQLFEEIDKSRKR